jgi:hypothetical protein
VQKRLQLLQIQTSNSVMIIKILTLYDTTKSGSQRRSTCMWECQKHAQKAGRAFSFPHNQSAKPSIAVLIVSQTNKAVVETLWE